MSKMETFSCRQLSIPYLQVVVRARRSSDLPLVRSCLERAALFVSVFLKVNPCVLS